MNVAVVSGAKVLTKIGLLRGLLAEADAVAVGGRIANLLLGVSGKMSLEGFDANEVAAGQSLVRTFSERLLLPTDVRVGGAAGEAVHDVSVDQISAGSVAYDVGPATVQTFLARCAQARTVMWNGPLGLFEVPAYAEATRELAGKLAQLTNYRVIGGGDTIVAIEQLRLMRKFSHISVGGGAMIALLEGKRMPGLEPLWA
jgi:phosphoglycerate kinase